MIGLTLEALSDACVVVYSSAVTVFTMLNCLGLATLEFYLYRYINLFHCFFALILFLSIIE